MIRVLTYPLHLVRRVLRVAFPVCVYIMWEVRPLLSFGLHRFKVGISNDPKARLRQVRNELGTDVRLFAWFPIPSALRFEQGFLHATHRIKCEMPDHSGKEEWRMWANLITSVICLLFLWAYDVNYKMVIFMMIALIPLPLDAFIAGLLLAVIWYAILCAGLFGAGWLIFTYF